MISFENGVYDLLENKFRETTKEDYINLTVNFEYNADVRNQEVYEFIDKILPNKNVRETMQMKRTQRR